MGIMIGSDVIDGVQAGSDKIKKIILGKAGGAHDVIWEKQSSGPVFVEEKHSLVGLAGSPSIHVDKMEANGWGWINVTPGFEVNDRKIYFEIRLVSQDSSGSLERVNITVENAGNSQEIIGFSGDGTVQASEVTQTTLSTPNYNALPVVMRMAIDIDNDVFWACFDSSDWNNSASADPTTSVGGIAFNGAGLGASGGNIVIYLDETGDEIRACLHETDFSYAMPSGFNEIVIVGEYA